MLFIYKEEGHILIVQVYVDDIIFGSSNPALVKKFQDLMSKKFEMSLMGELTFFLGLQVVQGKEGIKVYQQKYLWELLKKFGMNDSKCNGPDLTPIYYSPLPSQRPGEE